MDHPPRIAYSIEEFARLAAVGRTTIYQEIKSGRVHPVKVGKQTLVPADEARHWLDRVASSNVSAER